MEIQVIPAGVQCANVLCSNALGEGTFTVATFQGRPGNQPHPQGRVVKLLLCRPCAEAIEDDASGYREGGNPG